MRRLALVLVTLLVVGIVPVTAASAGPPGDASVARTSHGANRPGRPWPRHTITYVDRTLDHQAVQLAVAAWNDSGLRIAFVPVARGRRPDVIIRNSRNVPMGCGSGLSQLGYARGHQSFVNILHGSDAQGQSCSVYGQALVLTHELGHVLGLPHIDSACSIMNDHHINGVAPYRCLDPNDPNSAKPGRWFCGLLAAPELTRLKKWYGGSPRVSPTTWCDASPRIPATGPLSAVPGRYGATIRFTLTRAAEPAVPGWLGTWGYGAPGYEVHLTAGTCTAAPGDDATTVAALDWGSTPIGGSVTSSFEVPAAGTWCVTAWQFDQGTNYAAAPSTAMVTVS